MKKIFILVYLICFTVYGKSLNNKSDFSVTGKTFNYYNVVKIKRYKESEKKQKFIYSSLEISLDYERENYHFQAIPLFYKTVALDHKEIKNKLMYQPYKKSYLFFRSLYFSYKIDNYLIGVGLLPFSNSIPHKYNNNVIQDGVGINLINDVDLTSIFLKYFGESHKIVFGASKFNNQMPTGQYYSKPIQKSNMFFIIDTYQNKKWSITNELTKINLYFGQPKFASLYLYGIEMAWDDLENSGLVLYNVTAASFFKNNSINVKNNILELILKKQKKLNDKQINGILKKYPDSFSFDNNKKYYGASVLFGLRYDMDFFSKETFINFEWFHTFNNWISGNLGNIYSDKNNQMFNIRNNSYYVNYGILFNRNTTVRLAYTYLELKRTGKIGCLASTVPVDKFLGGLKGNSEKIERFQVIFTYRF